MFETALRLGYKDAQRTFTNINKLVWEKHNDSKDKFFDSFSEEFGVKGAIYEVYFVNKQGEKVKLQALNEATKATSVLPKPTSPHNNLSIGYGICISSFISFIALS